MADTDQSTARAEASSSKTQRVVKNSKSKKGPHSTPVSAPLTVTKPRNQYAETQAGDDGVEQIQNSSEFEGDDEDYDQGDDEGQDSDDQEEKLIRALRRMGIKAQKHFDPKRGRNFETWLKRTEFHLEVIKCPEGEKTNALILLLNGDLFEASQYLGITPKTKFTEAKQKLKDYFAITETKEELTEKLDLRRQEPGESIESFARDIKPIGHSLSKSH